MFLIILILVLTVLSWSPRTAIMFEIIHVRKASCRVFLSRKQFQRERVWVRKNKHEESNRDSRYALSYVLSHMCWRCCDYWHILCYETPGNTRGSAWSGERWRRFSQNKKQVQYSISLGFHRIALELGRIWVSLCLCEISVDFGEFHKETKTQDSGDQFISRYSPDIRVLSIYLQVYTCIFTRLCPKAGRVLNSARFFPLLVCVSIGTLETLIGSRAVPICEVRLFQYEIMVLACQVGPVHLTLAQINWEMNCIAKNKCTFRKTWSVQRRMNAPTESINEKLVAYEVTSSLVIALKSVSHLFVDRQTICNTKRAVLAVLIRFCGTILSETKSCKD